MTISGGVIAHRAAAGKACLKALVSNSFTARPSGTAGKAELDEELLFLQVRAYIATVPDPLDDNLVKWAITEAGRAMLRH